MAIKEDTVLFRCSVVIVECDLKVAIEFKEGKQTLSSLQHCNGSDKGMGSSCRQLKSSLVTDSSLHAAATILDPNLNFEIDFCT